MLQPDAQANFEAALRSAAQLVEQLARAPADLDLDPRLITSLRLSLAASQRAYAEYQSALSQQTALMATLNMADFYAQSFLGAARHVLLNHLGPEWSASWELAGFFRGSREHLRNASTRLAVLPALQQYLLAHPNFERPAVGVTADRAGWVHHALAEARDAARAGAQDTEQRRNVWLETAQAVRRKLDDARQELGRVLPAGDPRRASFGLDQPARIATAASSPSPSPPPSPAAMHPHSWPSISTNY